MSRFRAIEDKPPTPSQPDDTLCRDQPGGPAEPGDAKIDTEHQCRDDDDDMRPTVSVSYCGKLAVLSVQSG